jgi:hypothetical protein
VCGETYDDANQAMDAKDEEVSDQEGEEDPVNNISGNKG